MKFGLRLFWIPHTPKTPAELGLLARTEGGEGDGQGPLALESLQMMFPPRPPCVSSLPRHLSSEHPHPTQSGHVREMPRWLQGSCPP